MPTASMIWISPWPSQATRPMASSIPGTASRTSITRMRTPSTTPPAPPAMAPTMMPPISPNMTATTPTVRLIRAPYRTRLNSSITCLSVPMRCVRLGPCRWSESTPIVGSYGDMYGARIAPATKTVMKNRPMRAGPLRSRRRRASCHRPRLARAVGAMARPVGVAISAVPDPWVQERVPDVHDQIHRHEDHGEDQDQRLDDDEVVVLDRGDHPGAHAVPAEDRFGQHRAGEQRSRLEADHGGQRQPGVAHDVAVVDASVGQALGSGGPDIVLVADVDDRGSGDAGEHGQRDRAERDRRQDEVGDRVDHVPVPGQHGVDDREMGHWIHV